MLENIIVGAIILAAAAFAVYRLFFRPSCGCGSDCACAGQKGKESTSEAGGTAASPGTCCGENGKCCCGK